jgi:hypothetical protein
MHWLFSCHHTREAFNFTIAVECVCQWKRAHLIVKASESAVTLLRDWRVKSGVLTIGLIPLGGEFEARTRINSQEAHFSVLLLANGTHASALIII